MKVLSLNGSWKCKPDLDNKGIKEKWFYSTNYREDDNNLIDIEIPTSFNMLEGYEDFEGIFWHYYKFNVSSDYINNKIHIKIRFKGSNYRTIIWINNKLIGQHFGGFTPFEHEIKNCLKSENNLIVVRIDNIRRKGQIPDLSFDWFNWGGIYRNVDLLILNEDRIEDVVIKTYLISNDECKLEFDYKIIGNPSIVWEIIDAESNSPILNDEISLNSKSLVYKFIIKNPKLWTPDTPNLYYLKIYNQNTIGKELLFKTSFGIRQINIVGTCLYLNKKRIFLKGISLHEEYMPYGRTIPYDKRKEDVQNIKSLGFNAIRTAHYSHDENLLDIADKLGILILEEIPVYQHCDFGNPHTYNTAQNMLKELIKRDINHPSVIWWSVGNEIPSHQRGCARFIKKLMKYARKLDNTRIITCVSRKLIPDLTRSSCDVATINTYFGWYYGHEKMISLILDIIRTPVHNKPWIYTEFGAGAKYGFHADWKKQIKYSEEKQLKVLDYTIRTVNSKQFFAGWFIWIYRDFKSPKRTNQFQQGFNRKGIVSGEKNEKKLIAYAIPKIIDKKRKILNLRIIGILLWIIFLPLSYLIITRLIDYFLKFLDEKPTYINR